MGHNRKLVLGGVALVKGRLRNEISAMNEVRDVLEKVLVEAGWFPHAPFKWVGLIIRYGTKNDLKPEFQRINNKFGDLPVAIELDMNSLREADTDQVSMKAVLMNATIVALLEVAQKFDLPAERLIELRANQ